MNTIETRSAVKTFRQLRQRISGVKCKITVDLSNFTSLISLIYHYKERTGGDDEFGGDSFEYKSVGLFVELVGYRKVQEKSINFSEQQCRILRVY